VGITLRHFDPNVGPMVWEEDGGGGVGEAVVLDGGA